MNQVIQGLWIGPELSVMEQLSIASFLLNEHEYHLYVYDKPQHIPVGTVVRDANEILASSKIFQYKQNQSYAGFANFFRYKLLFERGGWWADTDTICLKPFDFPEQYVLATEIDRGVAVVSSGIIKAPVGSAAMGHAWEICQNKNPEQLVWGETGSRLMTEVVRKYSLKMYQKPPGVFCPIGYIDWHKVLEADEEPLLSESTYSIHLWNQMWRNSGQDKNGSYSQSCLYERLKTSYLPSSDS